jgi:hypothetical protein
MKTIKPLLPMKKLLAIGALALCQQMAFAQNVVMNPGFEDGPQPSGNGPYYFGGGWVDHWVGENIAFPGVTSFNNGNLYANNGTGFWDFPTGFSAHGGNRSASVVLHNDNGTYHGSRIIGKFTAPLGEGCWSLCLHLSNMGLPPQTADPKVEVFIYSSWGAAGERVIDAFSIPQTLGWHSRGKMFNVSFLKANKYDRIGIRIKQDLPKGDYPGIYIDDISLSSCGSGGDIVMNPDFNYHVRPFEGTADGGGINPVVTGDVVEEYEGALHYWELSASTGVAGEAQEWMVLPEHSFTTLTGHYESGEITLAGPDIRYKLEHLLFSPCGIEVARAYDLATGVLVAPISPFQPTGNETGGGGEEEGYVQKAKHTSTGVDNKKDAFVVAMPAPSADLQDAKTELFRFAPNPATNELNVMISSDVKVVQHTSSIEVVNDKGTTVLSTTRISHQNRLDLSNLPKGIYYIRVVTDNRVDVQKFIKQ